MQKIVNSFASKGNKEQIARMSSKRDAQVYQRANLDNLVFTRQVFNPELFFNQDTNKDDVQHD